MRSSTHWTWRLVFEGVRIGVGHDATDISFLTLSGQAQLLGQNVSVERVDPDPVPP